MTQHLYLIGFMSAFLAACGSGGGSGTPASALPWQGVVLDGYIQGAQVCLDLNDNQGCDANEPSATTGTHGFFSLDVGGIEAGALQSAHLIAVVPDTARDSDDHGRMLKDVGKSGYVMMSPAAGFLSEDGKTLRSAVVSPFTTLISYEMLKNPSKDDVKLIEREVKVALGQLDTTLMDDYLARMTLDEGLNLQARAIALGVANGRQVLQLSGSSDRVALLGAYAYARKNAHLLKGKTAEQIKAEVSSSQIELIDEAELYSNSSKQDVQALLAQGIYAPICLADCSATGFDGYQKTRGIHGQWVIQPYQLKKSAWTPVAALPDDGSRFLLDAAWRPMASSGTFVSDGQGRVSWEQTGQSFKVSARVFDMALLDKKMIANIPNIDANTKEALENSPAPAFPEGSQTITLNATASADSYMISLQQLDANTPIQGMARLETLLQTFATGKTSHRSYLAWAPYVLTFDDDRKITVWNGAPASCQVGSVCPVPVATGSYETRTVQNQRMLVTDLQMGTGRLMFAQYTDLLGVQQLAGGVFYPKGASRVLGGGYNKTAIGGLMTTSQKPPVVD